MKAMKGSMTGAWALAAACTFHAIEGAFTRQHAQAFRCRVMGTQGAGKPPQQSGSAGSAPVMGLQISVHCAG